MRPKLNHFIHGSFFHLKCILAHLIKCHDPRFGHFEFKTKNIFPLANQELFFRFFDKYCINHNSVLKDRFQKQHLPTIKISHYDLEHCVAARKQTTQCSEVRLCG